MSYDDNNVIPFPSHKIDIKSGEKAFYDSIKSNKEFTRIIISKLKEYNVEISDENKDLIQKLVLIDVVIKSILINSSGYKSNLDESILKFVEELIDRDKT